MAKKKKYTAVKLNIQLKVMASEDMVKRLENGEGIEVALHNCFKNNNRGIDTVSHEVLKQSENWKEIKEIVFNSEKTFER